MAELPQESFDYLSKNSPLFTKSMSGIYFRFVNRPPEDLAPHHFTSQSRFGTDDIRTMALSKEIKAALHEIGKKNLFEDSNNWTFQVYQVSEALFFDLRNPEHPGIYEALYQPNNATSENDRWNAGRKVITALYDGGIPLLAGYQTSDLAGVAGPSVSGSTHALMTGTTNIYMSEGHEKRETTCRQIYKNSIAGLIEDATEEKQDLASYLGEIRAVIAAY